MALFILDPLNSVPLSAERWTPNTGWRREGDGVEPDTPGVKTISLWTSSILDMPPDQKLYLTGRSSGPYNQGGLVFRSNADATSYYRMEAEAEYVRLYKVENEVETELWASFGVPNAMTAYVDGNTIHLGSSAGFYVEVNDPNVLTGEYSGIYGVRSGGWVDVHDFGYYKQELTVSFGSGSGVYHAHEVVTITADPPSYGKVFYKWEIDLGYEYCIDDLYAVTTTITMPYTALHIRPIYRDAGYLLQVIDGSGDSYYGAGAEAPILADVKPGRRFHHWETGEGDPAPEDIIDDPKASLAHVTMPAEDITLIAKFGARRTLVSIDINGNVPVECANYSALPAGLEYDEFGRIVNDGSHIIRKLPDNGVMVGVLETEGGMGVNFGRQFGQSLE